MHFLRTLSIRDVCAALRRRQVVLALDISRNLCSNAIGTARSNLAKRVTEQTKRAVRGAA